MKLYTVGRYGTDAVPEEKTRIVNETRLMLGYNIITYITAHFNEEEDRKPSFTVVYNEYETTPSNMAIKDLIIEYTCEASINLIENIGIQYSVESLQTKATYGIKYPRFARFLNWIKDKFYEETYRTERINK